MYVVCIRAISGKYPPASTLKGYVALCALEEGVVNSSNTLFDKGYFQIEGKGRVFRNWKRRGSGLVNISRAIIVSNDTFFYWLASKMGIDVMGRCLSEFGFGRTVGLDVYNESSGLIPSKAWKKKRYKQKWRPGDSLNAGIGQGYMLSTPIQMAYSATIQANRGKRILPRFVKMVGNDKLSFKKGELPPLKYRDENWNIVTDAMVGVTKIGGTAARAFSGVKYKVAGKTGTAQVVALPPGQFIKLKNLDKFKEDHAMFIGFAPADNPQIALAVIVENGGGGSRVAAPMSRKLIVSYLKELNIKQKNEN